MSKAANAAPEPAHRRILGLDFFAGTVDQAIERMRRGGLLVVPAAPALKDMATHADYREALLQADLVIPDSAFMVMVWNLIERDNLPRLSGLEYLRVLLTKEDVRTPGNTFWIMASPLSAERNLHWLAEQGIAVPPECVYLAPMYGAEIVDDELVARLRVLRPANIVVTVGGGTQERLGLYLKQQLEHAPAIHCIGAAIAFLSGDQVNIPGWADKFYMGWLLRCLSEPRRYVPRYWAARKLLGVLLRYRSELPLAEKLPVPQKLPLPEK